MVFHDNYIINYQFNFAEERAETKPERRSGKRNRTTSRALVFGHDRATPVATFKTLNKNCITHMLCHETSLRRAKFGRIHRRFQCKDCGYNWIEKR